MNDESVASEVRKSLAETPAIGISLQRALTENHTLVLQTHVPADSDQGEINGVLDKLAHAASRQYAVAMLPAETRLLNIARKQLATLEQSLLDAERADGLLLMQWQSAHEAVGRRGEWRPTPAQRQEQEKSRSARAQLAGQIAGQRNEIMQMEIKVAEMEATVRGE